MLIIFNRIINKYHRQLGFSLLEVLVSLGISAILLIAIGNTYSYIINKSLITYRSYKLNNLIRHVAGIIEKDIVRSGYCMGKCNGLPLLITQRKNEKNASCIIVAYDFNHNGIWEKNKNKISEFFGYRLSKKSIERNRDAKNCQYSGWDKITDDKIINVNMLKFNEFIKNNNHYVSIEIQFSWNGNNKIKSHYYSERKINNL